MSFRKNEFGEDRKLPKLPKFSLSGKAKKILIALVVLAIVIPLTMGVNNGGERTVIQYPWGTMDVKFDAGPYFNLFGPTTVWADVVTYDFAPNVGSDDALVDTDGIGVRYRDGGTGTIFGNARFRLTNDKDMMIKTHKEFKSQESLAYKLIKPITEQTMNLTAGLLTSEGAYAENRGTFIEWSLDQMANGKYRTVLDRQQVDTETGEREWKEVPVIAKGEDTLPLRIGESDLAKYGISVSGYNVTEWGFEETTLKQISDKREAVMAIITAKANAERAIQDKITAKQEGLKNVEVKKYEKEVEKQAAVTEAEKNKKVAILAGEQRVDVAKQSTLEAEEKRLQAEKYKAEQILRGEGDAERKRLVMEADGALEQKLQAYVVVNQAYAAAMANHRLVPSIVMGGSGEGSGGSAQALIDMFAAKTAADLQIKITEPAPAPSIQSSPNAQ
jgi:regulator of protease activity HflC (stomatin/prohibitin superfamily)